MTQICDTFYLKNESEIGPSPGQGSASLIIKLESQTSLFWQVVSSQSNSYCWISVVLDWLNVNVLWKKYFQSENRNQPKNTIFNTQVAPHYCLVCRVMEELLSSLLAVGENSVAWFTMVIISRRGVEAQGEWREAAALDGVCPLCLSQAYIWLHAKRLSPLLADGARWTETSEMHAFIAGL